MCLKLIKNMRNKIVMILIVLIALALRVFLVSHTWPLPNSDEGIMGMMAMHIQHGEHPMFFYGQQYMGTLQAYIGAGLFFLLGPSIFSLRLGLILLFIVFLVGIYLLSCLLYTRRFALFVLLLLSFGSSTMLTRQLSAIGGYSETIVFASLLFCLSAKLTLFPAPVVSSPGIRIRRHIYYMGWGGIAALGLWSDMLIAPFVLCTGIALLLFCWRDLIKLAVVPLTLGLLIGGIPMIVANITAKPGMDSLSIILSQQGHVPLTLDTYVQQLQNTLSISLPMMTGDPVCHLSEYPSLSYWGFNPWWGPQCHFIGNVWSSIYILLFVMAAVSNVTVLGKSLYPFQVRCKHWEPSERYSVILQSMRLLLLMSASLTLLVYLHSQSVLDKPGVSARYLIGLWISIPALLWPAWVGSWSLAKTKVARIRCALCQSFLVMLLIISGAGSYLALSEIALAHVDEVGEQSFIHTLLQNHLTHIYTDYWTCYRLAFESRERVMCAVMNWASNGEPEITMNRYKPYVKSVEDASEVAYVFMNTIRANQRSGILKLIGYKKQKYRYYHINEYDIYQVTRK
jgi:hypothetical protein